MKRKRPRATRDETSACPFQHPHDGPCLRPCAACAIGRYSFGLIKGPPHTCGLDPTP